MSARSRLPRYPERVSWSEAHISSDSTADVSATLWVALARLMRPQGRKGELLAELLTDLDPAVQFSTGRGVTISASGTSAPRPGDLVSTIESFFLPTGKNAGRIVLKLACANSISEAEALAGRQLLVPASELPPLDADTYYVRDLVGCALWDDGTLVGEVTDIEFAMAPDGRTRLNDATPLLVVHPAHQAEAASSALVPFALAHLVSVDLNNKRIVMTLPAGLLDVEDKGPGA